MEMLMTFLPLVLMFVVFYFLLIRPQQKRQREVASMQSALTRGDKIVTIGGLHATIDMVTDDSITVKVTDGSKLTFDKSAVREVVSKSAAVETVLEK